MGWTESLGGGWRDRVVLGLLAGLFLVPALVLVLGDKPSRFGFQMYSGYGVAAASWEDENGVDHRVDLADHLAVDRIEIDWTERLPYALCERLPRATSVTVWRTRPGADARRSVTC